MTTKTSAKSHRLAVECSDKHSGKVRRKIEMTKILVDREVLEQVLAALENHAGNYKLTTSEAAIQIAGIAKLHALLDAPSEPLDVKARAHMIDPDCWVSYSGKPKEFKQAIDKRRSAALAQAAKETP